jgi:hypothetical protein
MSANITEVLPKGQVLTPANGQAYEEVLHRWADNAVRRAKYVVLPRTAEDVSKAVSSSTLTLLKLLSECLAA